MEKDIRYNDKALRIAIHKLTEQAEQMKLSEGFTDRLMERIRREERAKKQALRRRRIWLTVGVAAAMALLVGVALHVMHGDEDASQQVAKKQEKKVESVEKTVEEKNDNFVENQCNNNESGVENYVAYISAPVRIVEDEVVTEEVPVEPEIRSSQQDIDEQDVCWILIPNTPFALKYSLTWDSSDGGVTKANVAAVECVTIEENDTVLIKSPSGEIRKGSMYVYEGEKKENDFVYVQDGRLLSADVRIYYKKAFLNADGQTYSYMDALALLDYPTCSLCMKD